MKTASNIRIHRHFGNTALSFGGLKPTVYLNHEQAAWLLAQLKDIVVDVEHRDFERSTFQPREYSPPIEAHEEFRVLTVSTNANSFGYRSVILVARHGEGVQALVQAYGTEPVPVRGDKFIRKGSRFEGLNSYQITALPPVPEKAIAREWKALVAIKP